MKMKEKYLNRHTIKQDTEELLKSSGVELCELSREFDAGSAGLVVLDMQDYFLSEDSHAFVPGGKAILPGIKNLIEAFQKAGRPAALTRHVNEVEDAGMMVIWWKDLITEDNPLSEITGSLKRFDLPVIKKGQYDAFYGTDLEGFLRTNDVTQLVITGVMTHLCCETTARSAFVRGLEVFFPADGTATYNAGFHRASLLNLGHGFARITTVAQLSEAMK